MENPEQFELEIKGLKSQRWYKQFVPSSYLKYRNPLRGVFPEDYDRIGLIILTLSTTIVIGSYYTFNDSIGTTILQLGSDQLNISKDLIAILSLVPLTLHLISPIDIRSNHATIVLFIFYFLTSL